MKRKIFRIEERAEVLRIYEVATEDEDLAVGMVYGAAVDPVSVEDVENSICVSRIKSVDSICRYWYKEFFARDMQNWRRLYAVFASVISME